MFGMSIMLWNENNQFPHFFFQMLKRLINSNECIHRIWINFTLCKELKYLVWESDERVHMNSVVSYLKHMSIHFFANKICIICHSPPAGNKSLVDDNICSSKKKTKSVKHESSMQTCSENYDKKKEEKKTKLILIWHGVWVHLF